MAKSKQSVISYDYVLDKATDPNTLRGMCQIVDELTRDFHRCVVYHPQLAAFKDPFLSSLDHITKAFPNKMIAEFYQNLNTFHCTLGEMRCAVGAEQHLNFVKFIAVAMSVLIVTVGVSLMLTPLTYSLGFGVMLVGLIGAALSCYCLPDNSKTFTNNFFDRCDQFYEKAHSHIQLAR